MKYMLRVAYETGKKIELLYDDFDEMKNAYIVHCMNKEVMFVRAYELNPLVI